MPPIATQPANTRRASFYGRGRTSSSSSSQSSGSSSSNPKRSSGSSSTTATSLKASSSPLSRQHSAVAAAAAAASKRILLTKSSTASASHVDTLKDEEVRRATGLDEQEYQTEIIEHMHHMQDETTASVDLMDAQPELRWFMRPYLVDCIVEIHQTLRLRPETLYLTMNIVDRYVSKRIVYKRHFQLVGCAALLIASKFEDSKDKVPTVSELSQMCCSAYDESAFTQMEGHVLSTIGWVLGFPTPEAWLRLWSKQGAADARTQSVARFLMEASLFHRNFIGVLPSHLTAGSLLLARYICGQSGQEEEEEAMQAAQTVDTYMMEHIAELSEILVKKYSYSHFANASNIVKEWYAKSAEATLALKTATATGLLPAQSVSAHHLAQHNKVINQSSSSFSTPQRSQHEYEEDTNMRSGCTTPSSMLSTPSRMSGDEEEDDEEQEDDADMPVTPLSLTSLHNPLVAAAADSSQSDDQKENVKLSQASKDAQNHLQVKAIRPALTISQQDNKILIA